MKKLQVYLVIVLCVFFTSCDKPKNSTKELEEIFTAEEIKDLNILVDYFESKFDKINIEENYSNLLISLFNNDTTYIYKIQYKYQDLLDFHEENNLSILEEIWTLSGDFYYEADTVKTLVPRNDRKYASYLKEVGIKNSRANKYTEELLDFNNFGRITDIFVEYDNDDKEVNVIGDFEDYNNRLIIAIDQLYNLNNWYRTEKLLVKMYNDFNK